MRTRMWWAIAMCVVGGAVAGAASAPPAKSVAPRRPPADPLVDYANRLRVGAPRSYRNLRLFAVFAPGVRVPEVDLTLDKAMELGLLEVTELKSAEVNRVRVRNRAKRPVFIMAGEMLKGARQDRIAGDDVSVPAGQELTIAVYCVEHGRWVAKSEGFASGRALAQASVRGAAKAGQSAVWDRVEAGQALLRAPSATGALSSVHESEEVQRRMKPYTRTFSDLPDEFPKACVVVAAVGDEILAADLFSSPALFSQLGPKLLESYIIDALERDERGRQPDAAAVKAWLDNIRRAEGREKDTPGKGQLYELEGARLFGSALVWQDGIVHLQAFPTRAGIAEPEFNSLQFRRERLRPD